MTPYDRPWIRQSRRAIVSYLGQEWGRFRSDCGLADAPLKQYDTGVEGFERFCNEVLGIKVWSKQREIVDSVINNRKTAVISGHAVGKSFTAALLCAWWYAARGYPVLTTGPTKSHVEKVLWRYIGQFWARSKRKLPGKWYKSAKLEVESQPWWWGVGFTAGEDEGGQGYHDPNMLIIGDEYAGLKKSAEATIRSAIASDGCRLLAIGNPNEERDTEFYQIFHDAEIGEDYNKIHISSWDSPNITGECHISGLATREWCEGEKRKLMRSSPDDYRMKIEGKWPLLTVDRRAIPYNWIIEAQKLWRELEEEEQDYLTPPRIKKVFVDVSELGKDRTAMVYLAGQRVHVHRWWRPEGQDALMKIAEYIASWVKEQYPKPDSIAVDSDAVGAGVYSRLVQLKERHPDWFGDCGIVRFLFNAANPDKDNFQGKIAWIWWQLREALDPTQPRSDRLALPPHGPDGLTGNEIRSQLNIRKWHTNRLQKKVVETKTELRAKGKPSPDVADAIVGLMHQEGELAVEPFFA